MGQQHSQRRFDVAIAGGGIAGCCAAILLARAGRRVVLLEKGRIPNHKLCGEFLSTEASSSLERLGVLGAVTAAGAKSIDRATITTARGAVLRHELPGTALGLSRYELDRILFNAARQSGAVCEEGATVKTVSGTLADGFIVATDSQTYAARAVLCAHGKRASLDTHLGRRLPQGTPWVAYKQHFAASNFPSMIEVHGFSGGYCGVSPIEGDTVNVCWIHHESVTKTYGGDLDDIVHRVLRKKMHILPQGWIRWIPSPGPFAQSSRPPLGPKSLFEGDICMIGDAAGMIAPLCGDGMSMAMRSASIASPLVDKLLAGRQTPTEFKRRYTQAWNAEFRTRLALGRMIQNYATGPTISDHVVGACARHPAIARWLIAKTRG